MSSRMLSCSCLRHCRYEPLRCALPPHRQRMGAFGSRPCILRLAAVLYG
jgi:hypothetical protein